MTYLDQKIMFTIMSSEFLEQAWLKSEKAEKAPHIVIMTKRFNDVSNLCLARCVNDQLPRERLRKKESSFLNITF